MLRTLPLVAVAVLLAVPRPAVAAPVPGWTPEQEFVVKVNKAIDRGVQYLRQNHNPNSQWEGFWLNALGDMDGGVTALATLALLNCGATAADRDVKQALDYLRRKPLKRTYVVGLTAMVYAEARQPEDLTRIQQNVDWLVANAYREGGKIQGWSYPFDKSSRPDGSNTQYALLGLYAGKQAGAKIDPAVWAQVEDLYRTGMIQDGPDAAYWYYVEGSRRPSFTMTVAGVSGLLIAGMGRDRSEQQLDPATGVAAACGRYDSADAVRRGMNWIGKHFAFDGALDSKSTYYNVYGIERVGRLSGQRFVGRFDWYREGCDWLVKEQNANGSWVQTRGLGGIDGVNVISTSFALLFLSKGRTPILVSKLAHGESVTRDGVLTETAEAGGVVGWNRKHNDARHLTEFASRELFNGLPLGWQVYDPRRRSYDREADILAEVGTLVQSPILYLNGHKKPALSGQQEQIVKRYVEEGGFVLAEACCGSEEFARGFRDLMARLFPNSPLKPLGPDHPIWRSYYAVPPGEFPKLECLELGCRTVVVLSPEPLAGYWEESRYMPKGKAPAKNRGEQAFRLAGNVIAYATGMEPPKQRGSFTKLAETTKADLSPPNGFLQPAQLRIPGEPPPAPAAMRNLMAHLRTAARIDVVLEMEKDGIPPGEPDLFKRKFLYLHGRKRFAFDPAAAENVAANLQSGGLLLADACCGKPEFDQSFRELMKQMFPDSKLEPIPPDDELYSAKLNGVAIRTVKRREKAGGGDGPDGGFRDLPPALEGIKLDGRWVVVYSKYDLGCALEGHKATDCLGHTRDSALQLATAAALYALKR